jgi:hypothetical protein
MIDNCIAKIEKVEEELRRSQLDATQLAQVPARTLKQIEDIMNVTQIQNALASTDDQIKTQLAQLEKTNEIQNVAMHDGEMQVLGSSSELEGLFLHFWPARRLFDPVFHLSIKPGLQLAEGFI